jgi:hypothetical protein
MVEELHALPGLDPNKEDEYVLKGINQNDYWEFSKCQTLKSKDESSGANMVNLLLLSFHNFW